MENRKWKIESERQNTLTAEKETAEKLRRKGCLSPAGGGEIKKEKWKIENGKSKVKDKIH